MKSFKEHKIKIIIVLFFIIALAIAFCKGGETPAPKTSEMPISNDATSAIQKEEKINYDNFAKDSSRSHSEKPEVEKENFKISPEQKNPEATQKPKLADTLQSEGGKKDAKNNEIKNENSQMNAESEETTSPAPEKEKSLTCTLLVKCDTIFKNMDLLKAEKADIIPKDGIIYKNKTAEFTAGESVFELLKREMKNNNIHLEFEITPAYNTAYIEGIANLYEFDCGELSGWLYKVNGKIPSVGCSQYILSDGDIVEILYTCDMGNDLY